MRFARTGSVLLQILTCVCLAPLAWAQAEGEVESIGFGGYYRTNCWTAMKLRLRPKIGTPETYLIQVIQEDLDRDRVQYSRPFTLGGNPEGGRIEERVWVYFIPDPRAPQATSLNDSLKVFLCKKDGTQLVRLSITGLPPLVEPEISRSFFSMRSAKLVLMVGDSSSRPLTDIFGGARGIAEDIVFQRVSLGELPTYVNGYDAVDAIVWLNADANELNPDALAAIEEYVRDGGKLVVCQNSQTWQRTMASGFAPMLPVQMTGVMEETNLLSLRALTDLPRSTDPLKEPRYWKHSDGFGGDIVRDPWADKQDQRSQVVLAAAKKGARINHWTLGTQQRSPYLCRWIYGLGSVAWVAQDLGDPAVISTTPLRALGWPQIWNKVFDWQNTPYSRLMLGEGMDSNNFPEFVKEYRREENTAGFGKNSVSTDISTALLDPMNPGKTGGVLIGLAIVFFIAYWLLAGPGSYFFLLSRKQSHLSWFAYAVCALAATGLTVIIVRAVLRGPPVLQHVTMLRVGPQQEAVARSQYGLYVKQDGNQELALKETLAKRGSYITPYPMHHMHLPQTGAQFLGNKEYAVPMRDRAATDEPSISVPFRSTLKKFQAKWVGKHGTIDGQLQMEDRLSGRLTNNAGVDLHDVYFVYNSGVDANGLAIDWLMHIPDRNNKPAWPKETFIEASDLVEIRKMRSGLLQANELPALDGERIGYRDRLNEGWAAILYRGMGGSIAENTRYGDINNAAILLSVFDRMRPVRAPQSEQRNELLRYANRNWDASHVVAAGHMLVLARGSLQAGGSKLPFPLFVEGTKTEGSGTVYYQFIVPIDRKGGAATQPTVAQEEAGPPKTESTQP